MTYSEIISFLFSQLAVFQRDGATAYKPGLQTSLELSRAFANPHTKFPAVHIAGTNGKGSTAHSLAAIFQVAGYKTALYTSPHLVDFRERIRINGKMIPKNEVVRFMQRYFEMKFPLRPSFFELTMTMAFDWFSRQKVDIAIIETGLGGRLDSTNIISPLLSIITNISYDHVNLLGDTLPQIAAEKAGIIKPRVPVVIGEAIPETASVFREKASSVDAPLIFAENLPLISSVTLSEDTQTYQTNEFGEIKSDLTGECQIKNMRTILAAVCQLRELGFSLPDNAVRHALARVSRLTGLAGRWMVISRKPLVVADTGHNKAGWEYIVQRLNSIPGRKHLVVGFVNDKDITAILTLMRSLRDTLFYITAPKINRALPAPELQRKALGFSLHVCYSSPSVQEAFEKALDNADEGDTVFIGGSNFVVADFLEINSSRQ